MRLGLGTLIIGGIVGLIAMGGLSGRGGGLDGGTGNGVVGAVTGDGSPIATERLALTIGGGYAVAKGGAKCLEKGRACFQKPGGGSGGGGAAAEDNAKGTRDDGDTATKDTTPPTAPPQPEPAPPAPPTPAPNPDEGQDDQAAVNPLGRNNYFTPGGRPGDRGQIDPGGSGRSDLMLPIPGVIRN